MLRLSKMTTTERYFQKYRIVWNISEEYDSYSQLESCKITIGKSEWRLELHRQSQVTGEKCTFAICAPAEDKQNILKCSYYLRSSEGLKKLEIWTNFLTRTVAYTTGNKMLVFAFEMSNLLAQDTDKSERWLEGNPDFNVMTKDRIAEISKLIQSSFTDSFLNSDNTSHLPKKLRISDNQSGFEQGLTVSTTPLEAASITETNASSSSNSPSLADKLISDLLQCFKKGIFCDVTIQLLNGGHKMSAHKLILYSGSSIWRQLLIDNEQLSIIIVPELDMKTVEELVTFMYDNSPPKTNCDTGQLLIAAAIYGVDGLKNVCEQQLIEAITIESAIKLMRLALDYKALTLFRKTVDFVRQNISAIKQRDEWKSLFFSYPQLAMEFVNNLI